MDLSGTQRASSGTASPNLLEYVEHWLSRRWVPIVINLAALALLSYGLARGTWRLLTPPIADAPTAALNENAAEFSVQTLLAANLFGQEPVGDTTQGWEGRIVCLAQCKGCNGRIPHWRHARLQADRIVLFQHQVVQLLQRPLHLGSVVGDAETLQADAAVRLAAAAGNAVPTVQVRLDGAAVASTQPRVVRPHLDYLHTQLVAENPRIREERLAIRMPRKGRTILVRSEKTKKILHKFTWNREKFQEEK